jgi:hypothetical protein
MTFKAKTERELQDHKSLEKTIKILQSHSPKSKLGKQILRRHDSIEALYKAHCAFNDKRFKIALASASDNPDRITYDAWFDEVMEFEKVEYDLACGICDFCYGEIEFEKGKCWPDLDSQAAMIRIEAEWDLRDVYWKDHPEELATKRRRDIFRRGKSDAAKELVVK